MQYIICNINALILLLFYYSIYRIVKHDVLSMCNLFTILRSVNALSIINNYIARYKVYERCSMMVYHFTNKYSQRIDQPTHMIYIYLYIV